MTKALTPLAAYFVDRARRAMNDGIGEQSFIDDLDLETLAQTPARAESYGLAMSEAMTSGEWPWDTSRPAT